MLMKDKKKDVALIISKMKPEGEEMVDAPMSEDGGVVDNSIALESAAEELIQAVESKDASLVVAALKSLMEMAREEQEPSED